MAGHHCDLALIRDRNVCRKIVLLVLLIMLRLPGESIMASGHHGSINGAPCYVTENLSPWNPYCIKCDIQCPVDCSCSLGNFTEVLINCSNGSISVARVSYPTNATCLSWAHNKLCSIQMDSFVDLPDTLTVLHLNNNSLGELQLGVFKKLVHIKLLALDLRQNSLREIQPGVFAGLDNLLDLDLSSNMLEEIQSGMFGELFSLEYLNLRSNILHSIQRGAFKGLLGLHLSGNMLKNIQPGILTESENLLDLDLRINMLNEIQLGVFVHLGNLDRLLLSGNMLNEIQLGIFRQLGNLSELWLDSNMLKEIQPGVFWGLGNLLSLTLGDNMLEEMQPGVFEGLTKLDSLGLNNNMLVKLVPGSLDELESLIFLYLAYNPLVYLHPDIFQNLIRLENLFLQSNQLQFLSEGIFRNLRRLQHLDLSRNNLKELGSHLFQKCSHLETLDLSKNMLLWIKKDAFDGLNVTTRILVDNYAPCCFISKAACRPPIPPKDPFLTCKRLLGYDVLRVGIWVVSILTVFSNVLVTVARWTQKQQTKKMQFILITNLSISDFLMGVYLIILLSVDLYYQDYFPSHSEKWRNSTLCKIAGSLSVLSSEASVFFITMISVDRFIAIKYPFKRHRFGMKSCLAIVSFLWFLAFGISITSFILSGMDSGIYAVPEICVGLPFSMQHFYTASTESFNLSKLFSVEWTLPKYNEADRQVSMYFSIAIFTVLNLGCFLVVGFCYTSIFISARKTTKGSGRSISLKEDVKLAKKMFLIVLTDFCCWVPIGILSILVQAGAVRINPAAYAWIATFILPINSAINPFLYTLGDFIANQQLCSCTRCRDLSRDETTEMR